MALNQACTSQKGVAANENTGHALSFQKARGRADENGRRRPKGRYYSMHPKLSTRKEHRTGTGRLGQRFAWIPARKIGLGNMVIDVDVWRSRVVVGCRGRASCVDDVYD